MKKYYLNFSVLKLPLSKTVLITVLLGALSISAVAAESPPLGHHMSPVKATPIAPHFTLPDIDGNPHSMSDFKGKVVMLNFWASWCPPCVREMPSMERLYAKYNDKGFVVVGVNQWEDEDTVFEFIGRLDIEPTFPILLDRESRASELYSVKGLPTTFLIDKNGNIQYRAMGGREFDHPNIEKLIEDML